MMGLVDYGSGSDSDSDGETNAQPQVAVINNMRPAARSNAAVRAVLDDGFFDADIPETDTSGLKLPTASGIEHKAVAEEGELEGDVKPRDWEIQLAEENKKKLEKKMEKKAKKKDKKKKHKKEKEEKQKPAPAPKKQVKAKISAFGALAALADESDSDDESTPRPAPSAASSTNGSKVGLFSILPAPKTGGKKTSLGGDMPGTGILLPPSMRKKAAPAPGLNVAPAPALKRKADSDDSDGEDVTDFFGLTSAPEAKQSRFDDIPLMPSTGFGDAIGPSKPPVEEEPMHASQMYNYADEGEGPSTAPAARKGQINDEMAYNLLSRDETVQVHDRRSLHAITAGIIDVNVDQALGPNLQSSLLKNITRHAGAAQMPGGLPPKGGDKTARQKHQITYLAQLAVSRDAALQEQWAASRHQKKMGREKYGF